MAHHRNYIGQRRFPDRLLAAVGRCAYRQLLSAKPTTNGINAFTVTVVPVARHAILLRRFYSATSALRFFFIAKPPPCVEVVSIAQRVVFIVNL
jgi:hypothetical protein